MQTSGPVDRSLLLGTLHDSVRDSLLPLDFGISLLDFGLSGRAQRAVAMPRVVRDRALRLGITCGFVTVID